MRVHGAVPAVFSGTVDQAVRRMVRILREFWDTCFAPHWLRMRTILEADIVYRGRQIAQGGLFTMLNDLSGAVEFDGRVISVRLKNPASRTEKTDGLGLTLVPTMFTRSLCSREPRDPPLLMYPVRGARVPCGKRSALRIRLRLWLCWGGGSDQPAHCAGCPGLVHRAGPALRGGHNVRCEPAPQGAPRRWTRDINTIRTQRALLQERTGSGAAAGGVTVHAGRRRRVTAAVVRFSPRAGCRC